MAFPGGLREFLKKGAKSKAPMDEKEPKGVKDSPAEEAGEAPFPPKKGKVKKPMGGKC